MGTAAIYVRRSKRPGERSVSMASQEKEIRDLCTRLGHEVVEVHSDTVSGAIMTRPGFLAWLAAAGKVDLLAAWAVDRSTRSGILGAAKIMEAIEGTGTRVVTVDGIDSDQPGFGINLTVRAEIAREERERTRARSIATRKALLDAGKWPAGPPPYGTRLDEDRRLEVDEEEAAVLREVAQRLLSGYPMRRVLIWLNEEGHLTRRRNHWTRSTLTTTLQSATSQRYVFTLAESRALAERLHPKPQDRPKGGRPVRWLLSGYAQCDGCGRPMTTSKDSRRGTTRYVCPTTTTVAPCPARATIRADRVDAYVTERYLEAWGDLPYWEEIITVEGDDVDAAERARDEAQAALNENPNAETLAAYQQAKEALEIEMAKPVVRRKEIVWPGTHRDLWEAADDEAKAGIIRNATMHVRIRRSETPSWNPERILISWTHEDDS